MMRELDFDRAIQGQPVEHPRLSIYRNNVASALSGALAVRFPVVQQLVGADFFRVMAQCYVKDHKPSSAVLIHYGESFEEFISSFEAAKSLPYLADVARFESAWWRAYHAGDSKSLETEAFSTIAPEGWGELKFRFHPAVQLIALAFKAATIWQWHQLPNNPAVLESEGPEFVLLTRSAADVEVRLIEADHYQFLSLLQSGASLEQALTLTLDNFPEFNLQPALAALMQLGLTTGLTL
jgi:hypothetical protein